ncbi:uncharacterized protein G2W53_042299 [Senna tora]|uniref:Uncharacterized protein n=1 Tax=Senna tora TaxID=362788 RepID=A0A834SIW1_9FABA|nr:uncharacterized protein G2W53_042299 [Senna tora]
MASKTETILKTTSRMKVAAGRGIMVIRSRKEWTEWKQMLRVLNLMASTREDVAFSLLQECNVRMG